MTLGGDAVCVFGWDGSGEESSTVNFADRLVADNPEVFPGMYGDEMEPVTLVDKASLELSPVMLRPLTSVELVVVGVGGSQSRVESVQLALGGGTVGYARRKIEALVGLGGAAGNGTHGGRLWMVLGKPTTSAQKIECLPAMYAPGVRTLLRSLQTTVQERYNRPFDASMHLLYKRHRTWKGLLKWAPKYELVEPL